MGKVHREKQVNGFVLAACGTAVISAGSWWIWMQNPWRTVTCKRCLAKRPTREARRG